MSLSCGLPGKIFAQPSCQQHFNQAIINSPHELKAALDLQWSVTMWLSFWCLVSGGMKCLTFLDCLEFPSCCDGHKVKTSRKWVSRCLLMFGVGLSHFNTNAVRLTAAQPFLRSQLQTIHVIHEALCHCVVAVSLPVIRVLQVQIQICHLKWNAFVFSRYVRTCKVVQLVRKHYEKQNVSRSYWAAGRNHKWRAGQIWRIYREREEGEENKTFLSVQMCAWLCLFLTAPFLSEWICSVAFES